MKRLVFLFIAALFLCGCALSTIEPYKKAGKPSAPAPVEETVSNPIQKLFQAPEVQEPEVEVEKEVVVDVEEEIK